MKVNSRVLTGASMLAAALAFAAPGFAQTAGHHAGESSYSVGGGASNSQGPITASGGAHVHGSNTAPNGNFNGGGSSASTTGGKPGQVSSGGWTGSGGLSGRETAPPGAPNNQNVGSSGWTP